MEKAIYPPDDTVKIPCRIVGYPPPDIRWYKVQRKQGTTIQTLLESGMYISSVLMCENN